MLRPLMQPDHLTRITREKFRAMMAVMFRDDVRLRREIFEAAMRMLGREIPVLPDSAFALPRPATARGLWRRWGDYARMVNYSEWYAYRLARRLARMGCDARQLAQSAPEPGLPADAGCAAPSRMLSRSDPAAQASFARARAPPSASIADPAPCKHPLAGSSAHL
jgi:hypothetical protein